MSSNELSLMPDELRQQVDDLYTHHHSWLYAWLTKRLGCSHQAADLSHDTFVRLLKKKQVLALREPRAYLTTIAHSLVVNLWRRRDIEATYLASLKSTTEFDYESSAEAHTIIIETLIRIEITLDGLSFNVRKAFILSQLEGLTYKEIGKQLEVSERMVKKYMAQAMLHCLIAAEHEH